jgi:hypothetical protein
VQVENVLQGDSRRREYNGIRTGNGPERFLPISDAGTLSSRRKVTVLKEAVEHHAGEEEDELFPPAKKLFPERRLRELGAEMLDMKEELQEKMGAA